MKEKETKLYFVEYKDRGGYGVGEEIEALSEDQAVKMVQMGEIREGGYMSRLIDVQEATPEDDCSCDDCNPEWKLDDGTVLEQEHQDTLNDAMDSMVNKDGLTLREAIELKSKKTWYEYNNKR